MIPQGMSPEDYIGDTFMIAEDFYNAYYVLRKSRDYKHMMVSGFLAARAAELYIKCLIIAHAQSKSLFEKLRKKKHDLNKLLNILIGLDENAKSLEFAVKALSKYEADKVAYAESFYRKNSPQDFGTDETDQVVQIRQFAKTFLDWH